MATINYINGNIDVAFFPTNTGAVRFCEKNAGGMNIATNNEPLTANTIKIGNSATTTALAGTVSASGSLSVAGALSVSGTLTAPSPATDALGTQVVTASWVRSLLTTFLGAIQTFSLGLRLSTIYGKVSETAFALWTETAGSTIAIGNGSTITLSGTTIANTVNTSAVGGTLALGGNITTGVVEIGKNQTTGKITVGSANSITTMNGNVGIGTTSPGYLLDVSGNSKIGDWIHSGTFFGTQATILTNYALYQNGFGTLLNTVANGYLGFNVGNTEKMRLTYDGLLGIGTTTPAYTLDISGTALLKNTISPSATFGKVSIGSPVTEAGITANYLVASGPTLTNGEYFTTFTTGQGMLILTIPYALGANKAVNVIFSCRSNQTDMYFRITNSITSEWLYTSQVISTTTKTYTFTFTNGATACSSLNLYASSETNTSISNRQFIYSQFSLYPESTNTLDVSGTAQFTTAICNSVNSSGTTTKLSIGENIINGEINIGKSVNGASSAIQIGDTQTTGVIQIGGAANRSGTIYIGNAMNSGAIRIGGAGSTTTVGGKLTANDQISYGYSTNPTLSSTSVGYSVSYSWSSQGIASGSSLTVAYFTNQPIGIYLLTVGPTTCFDFVPGERLDITFSTTTGISSLTSFTTMENGGNLSEKLGVCFSMPIKITATTNQLTCVFNAQTGGFSTVGGWSSITRIA